MITGIELFECRVEFLYIERRQQAIEIVLEVLLQIAVAPQLIECGVSDGRPSSAVASEVDNQVFTLVILHLLEHLLKFF